LGLVSEVTSLRSLQIGGVQAATLLSELLLTLSSRRSKRAFNLPPCPTGIERVTALEILGVTITGKLSMSEHVRDVVQKCAQSLHIIRVLFALPWHEQPGSASRLPVSRYSQDVEHGLRLVGVTTADDHNCIEAVVCRGARAGLHGMVW